MVVRENFIQNDPNNLEIAIVTYSILIDVQNI